MTDPISQYGRVSPKDSSVRSALDKLDKRAATDAKPPVSAPVTSGPTAARPGPDVLSLSNVAQKAMNEPDFDRDKVESIKKAIQEGQYPLDARRIAESFVAIERMISD
jgi:negative regulator of flagellin synthesis FlgM